MRGHRRAERGWMWKTRLRPTIEPSGASSLPLISIVTPSFNQAQFLEETIRSVLCQDYPSLEYIIVDGGSTDGSVEIIRKYEAWLDYWVSEPDRGQSDAINKGWARARGQVLAYLNSDDFFITPDVLAQIASHYRRIPNAGVFHGHCLAVDEASRVTEVLWTRACSYESLLAQNHILQPAAFVNRRAFEKVGPLDHSLHYVMDYEFWLRIAASFPLVPVPAVLAAFRLHAASKSVSRQRAMVLEHIAVVRRRLRALPVASLPSQWYLASAYLQHAEAACRQGSLGMSLEFLTKAIYLWPRLALRARLHLLILKLLIGPRAAAALRRARDRRLLFYVSRTSDPKGVRRQGGWNR